ncbi:basic leucine zipper 4-like [Gastrolobium bilobum]|uniref:basic leucine zipper 4-like n=1 Tax=Gastrolobium bilobum TaxID=150636 RepID=UPI002AB2F1FA|nr:basic leucine zipper 4-like [Gastrolobium bilobum]
MLSALPPSDHLLGNPFSAFAGGFTQWDCHDLFSAGGALKPTNPKPVYSTSGSDEPDQTHGEPKPVPDEPNQRAESVMDERKRRRMISNRESARRSRMRKQRHLENLRNQLNKCRIEKRELNNRLQFILYHCNRVQTENEWLRSERTVLSQKLSNFTQILVFQPFSSAWTCNSTTVMTE